MPDVVVVTSRVSAGLIDSPHQPPVRVYGARMRPEHQRRADNQQPHAHESPRVPAESPERGPLCGARDQPAGRSSVGGEL